MHSMLNNIDKDIASSDFQTTCALISHVYDICNQFENQPDFFELDQSVGLSCNNPLTVLANWKLKSESGCCDAS